MPKAAVPCAADPDSTLLDGPIVSHWMDRRRSGVLLHITSLPGPQPCGVLGMEARQFVDALCAGGFSVWQFLPLGPTHAHGSPYGSLSSFAGNPELIDLRECIDHGWLDQSGYRHACNVMNTGHARTRAALGFWHEVKHNGELENDVRRFQDENSGWLDNFALFAALKKAQKGRLWWQWPAELRTRDPKAVAKTRREQTGCIHQTIFEQYLFARQWRAFKEHAESHGVLLFGDLPIYAAHDSFDVWANQEYFTVNDQGHCEEVAGVPPDYFSDTGQRWGNPLYRWAELKADHFDWWVKRVQAQLERMHLLRIDHFRGLEAYWAIPGDRKDGRIGEWRPAPGAELLEALEARLGRLPLVAEDLGLITPEVHALRHRFGLPGMKVLQFAFGGDADNPYLPHNYEPDSVVYTGTHDNDTTLGWFRLIPEHVRHHLGEYLGVPLNDMPWPLIRLALESEARLAMIPMQDLLSLGSEARLNTPGTIEGNWSWRIEETEATQGVWAKALELNLLYGRFPADI